MHGDYFSQYLLPQIYILFLVIHTKWREFYPNYWGNGVKVISQVYNWKFLRSPKNKRDTAHHKISIPTSFGYGSTDDITELNSALYLLFDDIRGNI